MEPHKVKSFGDKLALDTNLPIHSSTYVLLMKSALIEYKYFYSFYIWYDFILTKFQNIFYYWALEMI